MATAGNRVFAREEMTPDIAMGIFTQGRGIAACIPPEGVRPYFVFLFGAPGSGKSFARSHLSKILGRELPPAVEISNDALVESLLPFRENTEAKGAEARARGEIINTQGIWTRHAKSKNFWGRSLIDYTQSILDASISARANIIFEGGLTEAKFHEILKKLGDYQGNIFFVRLMTPVGKIMEHLSTRGNAYMTRSPPFYRSLSPKVGAVLFKQNNEFFMKVIAPAAAAGALAVVEVDPFSTALAVERPGGGGAGGGGGGAKRTHKRRSFHRKTRKI
jgi:energy-coupling factor transporter ATP-binding protein EcfA2